MSLVNSLIVGFPVGIYIDNSKGTKTINNVVNGSLKVTNNVIAGCPLPWKTDAAITSADSVAFNALKTVNGNLVLANVEDVEMVDPFKYSPGVSNASGTPVFLLKPASPALSGADFTGLNGFQTVSYRGAFDGNNDWTSGWTTWNAENIDY
jgi:hypothetical protein